MIPIGAGLVGPYSAHVSASAGQTVNNNTETTLSFDTVEFNNGALYAGGQPTRLTAPVAGRYVIVGAIAWSAGGGDVRNAILRKNGNVRIAQNIGLVTTGLLTQHVTVIADLAAGDYVELRGSQVTGSSQTAVGGAVYLTSFSMALLPGQ